MLKLNFSKIQNWEVVYKSFIFVNGCKFTSDVLINLNLQCKLFFYNLNVVSQFNFIKNSIFHSKECILFEFDDIKFIIRILKNQDI
jgi:hypothetical protein